MEVAGNQYSPTTEKKYQGLTGPTYTLGNKAVRYSLPPPSVLKPFQDTKAGSVDTWPAHSTAGQGSSMTSVVLTKDKRLQIVDEAAMGKAAMVPKPRFLDQLETFLKKELKTLGVSEVGPSELRLQAHREVFEYLIEDFKTYKPLLAAIKNEYEMLLAYQREEIRQMEPLKQMLVTVSEQCDQKVMYLRDQEKQDIVDLKKENQRLYRKIDELKQEQLTLEAQVDKMQEELAAEYLRYRDECDARKMLVSDINDLRYQQEDNLMSKQGIEELDEGEKDDPITLKIALRKARDDEAAATRRLNEMEANYGDVIPRRDFETLQKQYNALEEKLNLTQDDFSKLKDDHDILLDLHKKVVQQRDEYYLESENLRRSATPRPEWNRCADYVAGGIMRWKELSDNKTSNELVSVLLNEISGGADAESAGAQYFDGQGIGPEVPKYLRYEGKVRNRRLGKRDCALLIRDIWREKAVHDNEKPSGEAESLAEFVHVYLTRRFALEQMVVEWAYNLHDAAQRYAHDEQIGLFMAILSGDASEELYHSQQQMISRLLNHLTKVDVDKGNQGALSSEDLQMALKDYLPNRDEDGILALVKAAETELEAKDGELLDYKALFGVDDEGKTGLFLDELKRQQREDRLTYIEEIKKELGEVSTVSVDDLKKAITSIDPEIDQPDLEKYLSWAFKMPYEQISKAEPMLLPSLIQRLQNGNLCRIGKK